MQLRGDVTDGRDLILVWAPSVQDPLRRIIQFLYCIKSHALNKCTFNLRKKKNSIYEKRQSTVTFHLLAVSLNFKNAVEGGFQHVLEYVSKCLLTSSPRSMSEHLSER